MLARRTAFPSSAGGASGASNNQNARAKAGTTELVNKLKAMDVALEQMSECRLTERQNVIQLLKRDANGNLSQNSAKENIDPGSPSALNGHSISESIDLQAPQETQRATTWIDSAHRAFFEEEIINVQQKMEALRAEFGARVDELQRHHSDVERRLQGQHEAHCAETVSQIETLCRGVESQREHVPQLLSVATDLTNRLEAVEGCLKKSDSRINILEGGVQKSDARIDTFDARITALGRECQAIASTAKAETKECGEIMQKMTKQMASFRQRIQKVEETVKEAVKERMKDARTELDQQVAKVTESLEQRLMKNVTESMERRLVVFQEDIRQQIQHLESGGELTYLRGALRDVQNATRRWPERVEEVQKRMEEESKKLQNTLGEKCLALHNEAIRLCHNECEELRRRCDYEAAERGQWMDRVDNLQQNVREHLAAAKDGFDATTERTVTEQSVHIREMKREMQGILEKQCMLTEETEALRSKTLATSESLRSSELLTRVSALELRCDARKTDGGDGAAVADLRARLEALVDRADAERAESQSASDECRITLKRLEASMADRAMAERRLARRIEDLDVRCDTRNESGLDGNVEVALEERIAALEVRGENAAGDLTEFKTRLDEIARGACQNEIENQISRYQPEVEQVMQQLKDNEEKARQTAVDSIRLEISENFRATQDMCEKNLLEMSQNFQKGLDEVRIDIHSRVPSSQSKGEDFVERSDWRHVCRRIDSLERRLAEICTEMRQGDDATLVQVRSAERSVKELVASQAEDNAAAFRSIYALVLDGPNSNNISKQAMREPSDPGMPLSLQSNADSKGPSALEVDHILDASRPTSVAKEVEGRNAPALQMGARPRSLSLDMSSSTGVATETEPRNPSALQLSARPSLESKGSSGLLPGSSIALEPREKLEAGALSRPLSTQAPSSLEPEGPSTLQPVVAISGEPRVKLKESASSALELRPSSTVLQNAQSSLESKVQSALQPALSAAAEPRVLTLSKTTIMLRKAEDDAEATLPSSLESSSWSSTQPLLHLGAAAPPEPRVKLEASAPSLMEPRIQSTVEQSVPNSMHVIGSFSLEPRTTSTQRPSVSSSLIPTVPSSLASRTTWTQGPSVVPSSLSPSIPSSLDPITTSTQGPSVPSALSPRRSPSSLSPSMAFLFEPRDVLNSTTPCQAEAGSSAHIGTATRVPSPSGAALRAPSPLGAVATTQTVSKNPSSTELAAGGYRVGLWSSSPFTRDRHNISAGGA